MDRWVIRPFGEQDIADLTETMCEVQPEPVTESETRDWHRIATGDMECPAEWLVAVDGDGPDSNGRFLGWGYWTKTHWLSQGECEIGVAVPVANRGKGVGTYLLAHLEALARRNGSGAIYAWIQGHHHDSLAWAQRHGYVVHRERTEALLDLEDFEASSFQADIERVRLAGIEIRTVWDDELDPYLPGMYKVDVETSRDVPFLSPESTPEAYEVWVRGRKDTTSHRMSVLALSEGEVVGFTTLLMSQIEGQSAEIRYTGVVRAHRGRGIGLALKVVSAVEAARGGVRRIRTNNDLDNPAILHLNRKMGFQPVPGPIIVKKSLVC